MPHVAVDPNKRRCATWARRDGANRDLQNAWGEYVAQEMLEAGWSVIGDAIWEALAY